MRIVAVGSPKGGVGKTTTAVTLAAIAARVLALRVLLVDADPNRSALDWADASGDAIPVDTADGRDLAALRRLRRAGEYDLAVVDLPGAHAGAFEAILAGEGGRPVADVLIVPTEADVMSVRPVVRVVRGEVAPLGLAHLIVLSRVHPVATGRAALYQAQLRAYGLTVADATIRSYSVYREALEASQVVLDVGSAHSLARHAERDQRHLAREALALAGLDTHALQEV